MIRQWPRYRAGSRVTSLAWGVATLSALMLLNARTARAAPPANDAFDSSTTIAALPFTDMLNTAEATADPANDPACFASGATVWYSFTSTEPAPIVVVADTFGSDYDTTLSIVGDPVSVCIDDRGGPQAEAVFLALPGVTYTIVVGSFYDGSGGDLQFDLYAAPPLDIEFTVNPKATVDPKTGRAALSGTVSCSYPIGVNIFGNLFEKINFLLLRGEFGASVFCRGQTAWTTPGFPAENGFFKSGKGTAMATAIASDPLAGEVREETTQAVKLGAVKGGGGADTEECTLKPLPAPQTGTVAFCSDDIDYQHAEAHCVALGGHLLSIEDQATQDFAFIVGSSLSSGDWWIGLDDIASEGVFTWTDGTPLGFTAWADGEPNDSGNEDCVLLNSLNGGLWNDFTCDAGRSHICLLP